MTGVVLGGRKRTLTADMVKPSNSLLPHVQGVAPTGKECAEQLSMSSQTLRCSATMRRLNARTIVLNSTPVIHAFLLL